MGSNKQIYDLRLEDLRKCAVWRIVLDVEGEDRQDECTVQPCPSLSRVDAAEGLFFVHAEFTAEDGTRFEGYCTPHETYSIGFIRPTIVTDRGQVGFWWGIAKPTPKELKACYEKLGKNRKTLFPLQFRCLLPISNAERMEGTVKAFLYSDGDAEAEIF